MSDTFNVYANNIKVWEDTKDIVNKNKWIAQRSVKYRDIDIKIEKPYEKSSLLVVDMDTLNAGIELKKKAYKPVVLNMCDWIFAGGCIDAGATTQEEDLFRRSNYFTTLTNDLYPMKNIDTIYSKNVLIFKQDASTRYRIMNKGVFMDLIAAPAPLKPHQDNGRFTKQEDIDLFKNKMRMLLKVAYANGNDSIVLSAWGCGAFYCPPKHTAELFKEVLEEFNGSFKVFVFAILDKNGALSKSDQTSSSKNSKNYKAFKSVLINEDD